MQIISEAQILQISAQHTVCFHVQEESFLEEITGKHFLAQVERNLGWVMRVCPGSLLCCGFSGHGWWAGGGSSDRHRTELRTLPAAPAGAGHSQASLTTSNFFPFQDSRSCIETLNHAARGT